MKNEKKSFCFSDWSYRNRKIHEIWGYLEAILRVLELIFGREVFNTLPPQIGLIAFVYKFWGADLEIPTCLHPPNHQIQYFNKIFYGMVPWNQGIGLEVHTPNLGMLKHLEIIQNIHQKIQPILHIMNVLFCLKKIQIDRIGEGGRGVKVKKFENSRLISSGRNCHIKWAPALY